MALLLKTPKLSDAEVFAALDQLIVDLGFDDSSPWRVVYTLPIKGQIEYNFSARLKDPLLKSILDFSSSIIASFSILYSGHLMLNYSRVSGSIFDDLNLYEEHVNTVGMEANTYYLLYAKVRESFQLAEADASLSGVGNSEWAKYRNAQTKVLRSLTTTAQRLIEKSATQHEIQEQKRAERYAELEKLLREEIRAEKEKSDHLIEESKSKLKEQEERFEELQSQFETKESHFVARQLRDKQIDQVRKWLEGWNLTKGTSEKRSPIFWSYVFAIVSFGLLTAYAVYNNYHILNNVEAIKSLFWWQWVLITIKAIFPLTAFSTFIIYFIRWNASWAERHASEEFRNRSLLIDIGRSSWLLEAVRDAQERQSEIPAVLLKELSHNLFASTPEADGSIHPEAVSDMLLHGLSSLRVKSPDGSEIEATRGKTNIRSGRVN